MLIRIFFILFLVFYSIIFLFSFSLSLSIPHIIKVCKNEYTFATCKKWSGKRIGFHFVCISKRLFYAGKMVKWSTKWKQIFLENLHILLVCHFLFTLDCHILNLSLFSYSFAILIVKDIYDMTGMVICSETQLTCHTIHTGSSLMFVYTVRMRFDILWISFVSSFSSFLFPFFRWGEELIQN